MKFPLDKYKKEKYWFHFLGQKKRTGYIGGLGAASTSSQPTNESVIDSCFLSSAVEPFLKQRPFSTAAASFSFKPARQGPRPNLSHIDHICILTILTILYIDHIDHHPSDICVNDCTADYRSQQPDQQGWAAIISWPDL